MLARELGVSRGLALECYGQLQAEGYLITRLGSATRVAPTAHVVPKPPPRIAMAPRLSVDFRPGVPDLTSFLGATGCGRWAKRPAKPLPQLLVIPNRAAA